MKATNLPFCHRSFFLITTTIAFLLLCLLPAPAPAQLGQETVERFIYAIYKNDTNTAMKMLESNTNLVYARENSTLPLLQAAAMGNAPFVKRILELGADIEAEGDVWNSSGFRMTALDEATQHRQLEVCKLLLEAGANPNHRGSQSTTLHLAFENYFYNSAFSTNRNAIATALLEYGADPFAQAGYNKTTPFELAINRSDGRLVPMMLDTDRKIKSAVKKSSRVLPRSNTTSAKEKVAQLLAARGTAMLSAAAQRGELEAVQALLNAGVSAKTNAPGGMPVMQVFAVAEVPAVKAYAGAIAQWQQSSNELNRYGTNASPWFLASARSREAEQAARVQASDPERWRQIRELLLKNGADYDVFAATARGDTTQAAQLLAADKNVAQSRDRDGGTPLHWAVLNDQLPLTSFWLQAGASPAATNFAGQTPLHIAATKGLVEHVKVLLAANAPLGIRDTNGWTPLDTAIHAQQSDCIHLLMAKAPAAEHPERGLATTLHKAAAAGDVAALAVLTETETNLEARNELGLTPLHVAGQAGQLGAAAFLIDQGADVNARDPDGNTVLHQILLSRTHWVKGRPSDTWVVERRKKNPSQEKFWRVYNTPSGYTSPRELAASVAFFLACGADTAATNHAGQTILQLVTADSTMLWDYDRDAILPLLQQSGNGLNERDADGNTALHRASMAYNDNSCEKVPALIASGADINATNFQGRTPLHVAVEKIGMWPSNPGGPSNAILTLIAAKANVNAQDNEGMTPLHVLALADSMFRPNAAQALLDAGANPNLRDKHGRTPAHLFLSGEWPWSEAAQGVEMLVKAGADLSAKDDQGKTPLHYLASLGSQSPMFFIGGIGDTFIAAKVDLNACDNNGNTPLQLAAKTGTRDVFDWLAKHGASLDATNNLGETPRAVAAGNTTAFSRFGPPNSETDIFEAVRQGQIENLTKLIKADPKLVNITNQFGQTPLSLAASYGKSNVVEFLTQHGAEWDIVSAVRVGRTDVVRNIIAQEPSSITNRYVGGATLLHLAASRDQEAVAQVLVSAGADVTAQNSAGNSPLGAALSSQNTNMANFLVAHGASENIFDATLLGHLEKVSTLIALDKSQIYATNKFHIPLTAIAVAAGHADVLKLLLDKDAPANPATGGPLLHLAASFNQSNTVAVLIRHGAKVDAMDQNGFTPLHLAAIQGSTEVAELLLKNNADPNAPVTSSSTESGQRVMPGMMGSRRTAGDTPLHLAALAGQTNIIDLLLKSGASVNATNLDGMTPLDLTRQSGLSPSLFLLQRQFSIFGMLGLSQPTVSRPLMSPSATQAAISLLERAGGKHGERNRPNGMAPFNPPAAMRAPPTSVFADGQEYHDQGCTDYNSHNFTNALADFRKSCELGSDIQDYSYYRVWILRSRLGETAAATQELAAYLKQRKAHQPPDWPFQIGRFLTGQLPEGDFIKVADNSNDQTSREQHCEAYFYAGLKRLIENDKTTAGDYLNKCLATKVETFYEYQSAKADLQLLAAPAPSSQ